MLDATQTGCIYHPNMLAVNRCKQCGKPTCHKCTVIGPTGKFCSENCKTTHQAFIQRAQATDTTRTGSIFFVRVRRFVGRVIMLIVLCLALGVIGSLFTIPYLTEATYWVRGIIGL